MRERANDELHRRIGILNTVLCAATAFMNCPTENHEELCRLAETLQEAIDIANGHDEAL